MNSRIFFVAIAVVVFAQSKSQVTFRPGLRAGANFSHFSKGDNFYDDQNYYYDSGTVVRPEFNNKTDFYVGFYGTLHLTKYYTLQPEFDYSRQGSEIEYSVGDVRKKATFDVSYLSIEMINKFTFTDKFNVHIGPTIDFLTDRSNPVTSATPAIFYDGTSGYTYTTSPYTDVDSDVDLAFVAGFGYNFTKNLGIEARIKKGIIPVIDLSNENHSNTVYSAGLTYTFDLK